MRVLQTEINPDKAWIRVEKTIFTTTANMVSLDLPTDEWRPKLVEVDQATREAGRRSSLPAFSRDQRNNRSANQPI